MKNKNFLERITNDKNYIKSVAGICLVLFLMVIPAFGAEKRIDPGRYYYGVIIMICFFATLAVGFLLPFIAAFKSASLVMQNGNEPCACCGILLKKERLGGIIGATDDGKSLFVCTDCFREANNKFTYDRKTGKAFIQGSEKSQEFEKQKAEDQQECAKLIGFKKFDKMQHIEARNRARLAQISDNLGDLFLSGAGQEREHDWSIQGGLASGIAGPVAGLAVAADTMVKNQQIRERNAARYQQGAELKKQSLISKINGPSLVYESDFNKKYTVDLTWSPDTLFSYLSVSVDSTKYDFNSKAVSVEARWKRKSGSPCVDGSLRAKIYDEQKECVGCAYLVFPKTGTGRHYSGIFTGICFLPKRLEHYEVKIEPVDLWELAEKGSEHGKTDGLTKKEHEDIVAKYKSTYDAELKK